MATLDGNHIDRIQFKVGLAGEASLVEEANNLKHDLLGSEDPAG